MADGQPMNAPGVSDEAGQREILADVAVVGGGLVGAAFALALAKEGLTSALIDRTPRARMTADDFDGRAYAVALSSRRFLTHLGVWDAVEPHAGRINDILVSDSRPGERASPLFLHFDAEEIGPGGFGHMVEDRHLRRTLLTAVGQTQEITHLDGVEVASVAPEAMGGAVARLGDGRAVRASLLVGADGRASALARAMGAHKMRVAYDQVGLVCAVRHEKPHHGVAHELFLPSGPFAILPLHDPHVSSLVWSEKRELAEIFREMDDSAYLGEIGRRFGAFLGPLSLVGKRWAYPLGLSLADAFVGDRIALIGDAARGIHPIAGQGMNYGLRDAAALAEVLGEAAGRGEDLGDLGVLGRYQRMRRYDSVMIAAATDGLNRLFSNDFAPVRWARRFGVAAFGRVGPLRRAAMRFAAGDRSDLPRSMRG